MRPHDSAPFPKLKRNLVAILRGLEPADAEATVAALVEAGFEAIEVPLNSPDPFVSIKSAVRIAPQGCLVGAGTVLAAGDVDRLSDLGAGLVVSPNVDPAVLAAAAGHGMVSMPGVFTATEALLAVRCGASCLKFFPASALGAGGIAAIRSILPAGTLIGAVGGVSETDFSAYGKAGITTFGIGSSLFKPGDAPKAVGDKARAIVAAYDEVFTAPGTTGATGLRG